MEIDDKRTVESVLSGNRDAFADLVRAHQARVQRYCLLLLRNPTDAEEAAQDVFVKAYRSLDQFRSEASFLTWAGRIAHNHCMDLLRQRTRRKTESLDAIIDEDGTPLVNRLAEPERTESPDELTEAVPKLLASLKEEYREILVLRELQELSYDDIAKVLKCSLDTVKSRLKRARAEFHDRAMKFRRIAGGRV